MTWRWKDLKEREKRICLLYVVSGKKRSAVAQEVGVSLTRLAQMLDTIYRVLDVQDVVGLAFRLGQNWKRIKR